MHTHEKKAFLKFFITYFISVAILILAAGYFYFSQTSYHYLKAQEFSVIEYARHIKMGNSLDGYTSEYHYNMLYDKDGHIDIRNFSITKDMFMKYIPISKNEGYIQVFKSTKNFNDMLWKLKKKVITIQIALLFLFALISYILARSALKPLKDSISTLDKFAKDLIHDLNTPVTSIKLNMKLLQKIPEFHQNKALLRLNKSVNTISELHENLTILLEEETFQLEVLNICKITKEIIEIQKPIYPDIEFINECRDFKFKTNQNAIKQILQNIISNACKYNYKNGFIKIYSDNNQLFIEDNGKGIKEPSKIFNRSFSEENSSGLGLDIVKRLANAINITIEVQSNQPKGTIFILTMC